jgi:photosystem II stability/assembly factor-like uncharacterized protein
MKKTTIMILLGGLFSTNSLLAQFLVKDTFFETCGVSNQGTVSGYNVQAGPYSLWNPQTNTVQNIGGVAPGNSATGSAEFSLNGNFISGTNLIETTVPTAWQRNVLSDYQYIFRGIAFPDGQGQIGYAAGEQYTYNGNGIVLKTIDGGATWTQVWADNAHKGIEAMSFVNATTGYVCGWNEYCAKTTDGGTSWTILDPGGAESIWYYTSVDFIDENHGVVGAFTNDENVAAAMYVTADGGATWTAATGIIDIPYKITHTANGIYYAVSNGGRIQKSVNGGLTWTTIYNNPANLLVGINFYDNMTGIVTCESNILKTVDGGATWTQSSVSPFDEGAIWRDVVWTSANKLVIVGTPDLIFESNDGGATWNWANETLFNGEPALYDVVFTGTHLLACGSQGNFYKKALPTTTTRAEMSRYNATNNQWVGLGSLGFTFDGNVSSGANVSGDGNTVVGNSWANPANGNGTSVYTHAVAWSAAEGLMDLGSLYANQNMSSVANAISNDGNVVVGYQEANGPFKSAVWRKNPAGGYFPNEYLVINPNGSTTNEFNQLGECTAVSGDGNWIGGNGDYANENRPWVWSQSTGVIILGTLGGTNSRGYVSAINYNGTTVTGWFTDGPFNPTIPFIWTSTGGLYEFNAYVTNILGFPLADKLIHSASTMSPNGKYIAGSGFDSAAGEWGEFFTFRVEMPNSLGVNHPTGTQISVYPNPVKDYLNLSSIEPIISVAVYSVNGQLVLNEKSQSGIQRIDMSTLNSGVYFVKATTENGDKTIKLIKGVN